MPQLVLAAVGLALLLSQTQSGISSSPSQLPESTTAPPVSFDVWLNELKSEARSRGFTDEVVAEALDGLTPLERVVTLDRNQAEVTLTFDRYYRSRITPAVLRRGRDLTREHGALLRRIERQFGVPHRFLVAIWGMETRYGRVTGRIPVFQALATLAWEPRRADYFRGELFNAMTMVAEGYIEAESMTGSWAGAMGQTQFMPSSYLRHAVDFDGDGRRDIWSSVADSLASIANYLRAYGWEEGLTWGREVRIPAAAREKIAVPLRTEGCSARRGISEYRTLDEWRSLGVRRTDGGPLPDANVYAAFAELADKYYLLYPNYDALLGYNCAHLYALSVALFSDRLR